MIYNYATVKCMIQMISLINYLCFSLFRTWWYRGRQIPHLAGFARRRCDELR